MSPIERSDPGAKAQAHVLGCGELAHLAPVTPRETRRASGGAPPATPSPRVARPSTLPPAGSAAERVGGQAREGKGEEEGREGEGEARPRGGGALSRGLPGSLAAAVVMSAMLAMAQGADRAGERRI